MIVKVQLALHSSDGTARCLIYNKDRSVEFETVDPDVIALMRGRSKVYFEAGTIAAVINGSVPIIIEVSDQDW